MFELIRCFSFESYFFEVVQFLMGYVVVYMLGFCLFEVEGIMICGFIRCFCGCFVC